MDITHGTFSESGESFSSLVDTDADEYRKKIESNHWIFSERSARK